MPLMGVPVINFIIRRLKPSKMASEIILATTDKKEDDVLVESATKEGITIYRGSENDVLQRYVKAAEGRDFDYAVRVTGDCPFVGADTLDYVLSKCIENEGFDLLTTKPNFPKGIDYEVYPVKLLEEVLSKPDLSDDDREHMLNYIYRNSSAYDIQRVISPDYLQKIKSKQFLLDTETDYIDITDLLKGNEDFFISPNQLNFHDN